MASRQNLENNYKTAFLVSIFIFSTLIFISLTVGKSQGNTYLIFMSFLLAYHFGILWASTKTDNKIILYEIMEKTNVVSEVSFEIKT